MGSALRALARGKNSDCLPGMGLTILALSVFFRETSFLS
jgi:hypothetical protein